MGLLANCVMESPIATILSPSFNWSLSGISLEAGPRIAIKATINFDNSLMKPPLKGVGMVTGNSTNEQYYFAINRLLPNTSALLGNPSHWL